MPDKMVPTTLNYHGSPLACRFKRSPKTPKSKPNTGNGLHRTLITAKNKPFCDGAHNGCGFQAAEKTSV